MSPFLFSHLIDEFELQHAIKYRDQVNKSGYLPYHGNKHANFLLEDLFEYYLYNKISNATAGDTSWGLLRALFLAGIFHDVNHSGGVTTDNENIENAILAFKEFVETYDRDFILSREYSPSVERYKKYLDDTYNLSCELIRWTEYPYIKSGIGYKTEFIQVDSSFFDVIRDADLMSAYHGKEGEDLVCFHLYEEFRDSKGITYTEYKEKQSQFLKNIKWNTSWGRDKAELLGFEKIVQRLINRMDSLNLVHS